VSFLEASTLTRETPRDTFAFFRLPLRVNSSQHNEFSVDLDAEGITATGWYKLIGIMCDVLYL